jgi:hypothetical protein
MKGKSAILIDDTGKTHKIAERRIVSGHEN